MPELWPEACFCCIGVGKKGAMRRRLIGPLLGPWHLWENLGNAQSVPLALVMDNDIQGWKETTLSSLVPLERVSPFIAGQRS